MYQDRVLAFVDVLGFSGSIKRTMKDGEEDGLETKRINSLIDDVQWDLNYEKEHFGEFIGSKVASQFSDSLIVSYLMNEESGIFFILLDLLHLCATALQNGFLFRGAVVCDKVYHTEKKAFGPAMVKACEMEKKLAIYPRIILDKEIVNIAKVYHSRNHSSADEIEYINGIIKKDFDGLYYIDYFEAMESELDNGIEEMPEYLEMLRKIIKESKGTNDFGIESKYLWLKEKFNSTLNKYKSISLKEEIKTHLPDVYEYYNEVEFL